MSDTHLTGPKRVGGISETVLIGTITMALMGGAVFISPMEATRENIAYEVVLFTYLIVITVTLVINRIAGKTDQNGD